MNYGKIKPCDVANGPGVRVSLFVSGCTHRCAGCFNPETWDFQYGEPFDQKAQEILFSALAPAHIAGLTLLGGEPLEYANWTALLPFLREERARHPEKNIWCYTGYRFEEDVLARFLKQWPDFQDFLSCIDVLVDGPFLLERKDISLPFRGSDNQRILLLRESLAAGRAVSWEG